MAEERFTARVGVSLLIRKGNKIFLLERANTGIYDGTFTLPGGHINGGESAVAAVIREAKEEIDIVVNPEDVELVHTLHRLSEEGDHERFDLIFKIKSWQGTPNNAEPEKASSVRWFDEDDLPKKLPALLPDLLNRISVGENYSQVGFDNSRYELSLVD